MSLKIRANLFMNRIANVLFRKNSGKRRAINFLDRHYKENWRINLKTGKIFKGKRSYVYPWLKSLTVSKIKALNKKEMNDIDVVLVHERGLVYKARSRYDIMNEAMGVDLTAFS